MSVLSITLFVICVGTVIGAIRFWGVRLGVAGVLGVALLYGFTCGAIPDIQIGNICIALYPQNAELLFSFLSTLGTALFLSVVSLQAGTCMCEGASKRKYRALLGGMTIVLLGAISTLPFIFAFKEQIAFWIGALSGGMTSTPTMAVANELFAGDALVTMGYGASYCFGLYSIVLTAQFLGRRNKTNLTIVAPQKENMQPIKTLQPVMVVALGGTLLGSVRLGGAPIGTTVGVLVVGTTVGLIIAKNKKRFEDGGNLRNLGLMLFFVGAGVPAGLTLTKTFLWQGFVAGAVVSLVSITMGYIVIRHILRFNIEDSLSVLCGGMTSTPAIVVLHEKNPRTDLSLYTISYLGALISLVLCVHLLALLK